MSGVIRMRTASTSPACARTSNSPPPSVCGRTVWRWYSPCNWRPPVNDIERLTKAVRAFHEARIDFVLIGGLAMIAHGANNLTRDVDLAYAIEAENVERLAAFLAT